MEVLQQKLGYKFNNIKLLENALTHSSYANEVRNGQTSNERLEFLGDSVLSIIVAEYLFTNFKNIPEGELTKLRAAKITGDGGCDMIITNGAAPECLYDIIDGKAVGTRFHAKKN